ncbi:MAG: flagellar hook-basal body protein [Mariprofundaceae bacterium]|nr:flagellar hook-basal body protein [Mariprofundaceae bacterium]
MNSGFFVAGVSGQMAQKKMDEISHNLANVNTAGFIASRSSFKTVFTNQNSAAGNPDTAPAAFLSMGGQYVDTREGSIQQTGNDMDFSILGDAWFRIQSAPGQEAYTRAGNFTLDNQGNMRTQDGKAVLDSSGSPIQLPTGQLTATDQGDLLVNGTQAASFGMVKISNPSALERIGNTLVKTPIGNTTAATGVSVRQGSLEGSNVNSVLTMTEMIDTLRNYQAMIKMIEQYNQQSSQLTQQVGQVQG